jgi:hypothetical protein
MLEPSIFYYESNKEFSELYNNLIIKIEDYLNDNKDNLFELNYIDNLIITLNEYINDFTKKQNNDMCYNIVNIIIDSIEINLNYFKNFKHIFCDNFYNEYINQIIKEYIKKIFIYDNKFITINFISNKYKNYF